MKIQVISDLHREFGFMDISFNNADVVILAGDVNLGTKGIEWIKSAITSIPVIFHSSQTEKINSDAANSHRSIYSYLNLFSMHDHHLMDHHAASGRSDIAQFNTQTHPGAAS